MQKMERERERWAAVTCDGRLFHRREASTGNALSLLTVDIRIYVERPETLIRQNVIVVWLQCLLSKPCTSLSVLTCAICFYVLNYCLHSASE